MKRHMTVHTTIEAKRPNQLRAMQRLTLAVATMLVALFVAPSQALANDCGTYSVKVNTGYLALRTAPSYDERNEIGELYTGEVVQVQDRSNGQYWWVYSPKLGKSGYVNADYLVGTGQSNAYNLTGVVHTHHEMVNGRAVSVTSMTLDAPITYSFTYKGTVTTTAREIELENSITGGFGQWRGYEGKRITIGCNNLHQAIHDASMRGVDAFIIGEICLLS